MSRSYHSPAPDAGLKPVPNLPLAFRHEVAARALGISPRTLWSLTKAGRIPHVRLGACVIYPVPGLVAFLEQQTINPIVRRPDDAARGDDDGKGVTA
jgi:Helix-turn-helix domain